MYTSNVYITMDTYNHVIVHMFNVKGKWLLRTLRVDYSVGYLNEFKFIYGTDESLLECYNCFYNCSEWYERLVNDIKFKKFRGVTLNGDKGRAGLWEASAEDSIDMVDWFQNGLEPFVRMKLASYYEEDDDDVDSFKMIADDMLKLPSFDVLNDNHFVDILWNFTQTREIDSKNRTVLSRTDIALLILRVVVFEYSSFTTHFSDDVVVEDNDNMDGEMGDEEGGSSECKDEDGGGEGDAGKKKCKRNKKTCIDKPFITKCDVMRGWMLETDGIDTLEMKQVYTIFKAVGITESMLMKIKRSKQYDAYATRSLDQIEPFEGWDMQTSFSSKYSLIGDLPLPCTFFKIDDLKLPVKVETVAQVKPMSYIYKNVITGDAYLFQRELMNMNNSCMFEEFESAGSLVIQTDKGRAFFQELLQNDPENDALVEDLNNILDVVNQIRSNNGLANDTIKKNSGNRGVASGVHIDHADMQKIHTKTYVDKYKDDTTETLASHAVEKVFTYLSNFLKAGDINMNKIGQDLVDLGVKKTRKAKGNVYGMKNPPKSEVSSVSCASAANDSCMGNSFYKGKNKNMQLRSDPEITTANSSFPLWNMSSWAKPSGHGDILDGAPNVRLGAVVDRVLSTDGKSGPPGVTFVHEMRDE